MGLPFFSSNPYLYLYELQRMATLSSSPPPLLLRSHPLTLGMAPPYLFPLKKVWSGCGYVPRHWAPYCPWVLILFAPHQHLEGSPIHHQEDAPDRVYKVPTWELFIGCNCPILVPFSVIDVTCNNVRSA